MTPPRSEAAEPPVLDTSNQRTAKKAAEILVELGLGFAIPTAKQRKKLVAALYAEGYSLYEKAFDVIRATAEVDLDSESDIRDKLSLIVFYEIKSTNKDKVLPDFRRYFFSLSTAELLAAQNLGERYRFVFVNIRTREHKVLALQEVFGRAKGIYPYWSIQF